MPPSAERKPVFESLVMTSVHRAMILCLVLLMSCAVDSDDGTSNLFVTLEGLSANVHAVDIFVSVEDGRSRHYVLRDAEPTPVLMAWRDCAPVQRGLSRELPSRDGCETILRSPSEDLAHLGIVLHDHSQGQHVSIRVQAFTERGCYESSGEAAGVTISKDTQVRVAVAQLPTPMCPVEVEQIEGGHGSIDILVNGAPNLCQGNCRVDVPQGALVNMLAKPERRSYFMGWDGVCDTGPRKEPCEFTVAKAAQVSARIGPRLCSGDFCTDGTPLGGAHSLKGVWASSERDVWAVGNGRLLHYSYDANQKPLGWQLVDVPKDASSHNLNAIWGRSASEVYAVGDKSTVLKLQPDGSWRRISLGLYDIGRDLYGVWGNAEGELWVVGSQGFVLHQGKNQEWQPDAVDRTNFPLTLADLHGIWGSANGQIWIVGAQGVILHYGNTPGQMGWKWLDLSEKTKRQSLNAVWGSSESDVWAVGDHDVVLHYQRTSWELVRDQDIANHFQETDFTSIWGTSDGNIWFGNTVAGMSLHCQADHCVDNDQLKPAELGATFGLFGIDSDHIFAVGADIQRFDGKKWLAYSYPNECNLQNATLLAGYGPDDLWVPVDTRIAHRKGIQWECFAMPKKLIQPTILGIWSAGPNDIWAVGFPGAVFHYDGRWMEPGMVPRGNYSNVWSRAGNVVIAGVTGIEMSSDGGTSWKGGGFSNDGYSPGIIYAIWGSQPTDIIAAGKFYKAGSPDYTGIAEWDGAVWKLSYQTSDWVPYAISGSGQDVYAVGSSGHIAHRTMDGGVGVWNKKDEYSDANIAALTGVWTNQRRTFAAGSGALLERSPESGEWKRIYLTSLDVSPSSIWAVAGDIWLLGPNSLVRYVSQD